MFSVSKKVEGNPHPGIALPAIARPYKGMRGLSRPAHGYLINAVGTSMGIKINDL